MAVAIFSFACYFSSQAHLWEVSDVYGVSVKRALHPLRVYSEKRILELTPIVPDKEQDFLTHTHAQTILHHILHSSQFMICAVCAHCMCVLFLTSGIHYMSALMSQPLSETPACHCPPS